MLAKLAMPLIRDGGDSSDKLMLTPASAMGSPGHRRVASGRPRKGDQRRGLEDKALSLALLATPS